MTMEALQAKLRSTIDPAERKEILAEMKAIVNARNLNASNHSRIVAEADNNRQRKGGWWVKDRDGIKHTFLTKGEADHFLYQLKVGAK